MILSHGPGLRDGYRRWWVKVKQAHQPLFVYWCNTESEALAFIEELTDPDRKIKTQISQSLVVKPGYFQHD